MTRIGSCVLIQPLSHFIARYLINVFVFIRILRDFTLTKKRREKKKQVLEGWILQSTRKFTRPRKSIDALVAKGQK